MRVKFGVCGGTVTELLPSHDQASIWISCNLKPGFCFGIPSKADTVRSSDGTSVMAGVMVATPDLGLR